MISVKPIQHNNLSDFIDTYYYGWTKDEITALKKNYQSNYHGSVGDACFEISDCHGDIYYAIFRNYAEYDYAKKSKSYLVFKDKNRMLLNVGGSIYRYLINDKKLLNNDNIYDAILQNDASGERSMYFQSMAAIDNELMIIVDDEGIACLGWNGVLWKKPIEFAYAGYFKLQSIKNNFVVVIYDNISADKYNSCIRFDIYTGEKN